MKYCSLCGHSVSKRIPPDDDRERYVCDNCSHIHYENPRVIVGVLPSWGTQVLLCKRAIEPRKGYWTIPAGFLENGESTADGARRETWEEACAEVGERHLYCIYDLPHINQVYVFFRAELLKKEFAAGPESLDVQLFEEQDIPWQDLAFPVVTSTLKYYYQDRKDGVFPTRNDEIWFKRRGKREQP